MGGGSDDAGVGETLPQRQQQDHRSENGMPEVAAAAGQLTRPLSRAGTVRMCILYVMYESLRVYVRTAFAYLFECTYVCMYVCMCLCCTYENALEYMCSYMCVCINLNAHSSCVV